MLAGSVRPLSLDFEKGKWTVDENPERQEFTSENEALNRARVIGGDPDLDV
jgi:hypothetical protein